jgi:hypothetical protein
MISQAHQDLFALTTAKNKTYIEIGAFDPIKWSNTYRLEMNDWKGFGIEFVTDMKHAWDQISERKNKVYFENALTFNYINAIEENNLGTHIGYLSCDIEPPQNTFAALKRVIEQGITFDCITFEHDKYQSEVDFDSEVRKYLSKFGYKVAVEDVYFITGKKLKNYFETWFVNEDIEFLPESFDQWKFHKLKNVKRNKGI